MESVRWKQVVPDALRAVVPFQVSVRDLKRRLTPYQDNPGNSAYCITEGLKMLGALRDAGVRVEGVDVLEFGSGWLPLIPLIFQMAGARRLILTDVARLMDATTIARAKRTLEGRLPEIAATLRQPEGRLRDVLKQPFRHDYLVPWNAASHPSHSADLVISRATFEHVPADSLAQFLIHFRRVLRPDGAMCHCVDNSDHWEHKDHSLSRVDMLRYEDDAPLWRLAQLNEQSFQNRLRHSDYVRMMTDAGFGVVSASGVPDPKCLADLPSLPLASRFRHMAAEDLAILTSAFVARKV
jgi:SAM-dependent methyltransferase